MCHTFLCLRANLSSLLGNSIALFVPVMDGERLISIGVLGAHIGRMYEEVPVRLWSLVNRTERFKSQDRCA